jgi:hypothetical protein
MKTAAGTVEMYEERMPHNEWRVVRDSLGDHHVMSRPPTPYGWHILFTSLPYMKAREECQKLNLIKEVMES